MGEIKERGNEKVCEKWSCMLLDHFANQNSKKRGFVFNFPIFTPILTSKGSKSKLNGKHKVMHFSSACQYDFLCFAGVHFLSDEREQKTKSK